MHYVMTVFLSRTTNLVSQSSSVSLKDPRLLFLLLLLEKKKNCNQHGVNVANILPRQSDRHCANIVVDEKKGKLISVAFLA